MPMSEQQKNLRSKLRDFGYDVRAVGVPADPEILQISRPGKRVLFVMVNDMGADGYSLWMPSEGIRIEDDLKAIRTHDNGLTGDDWRHIQAAVSNSDMPGDERLALLDKIGAMV